MAAPHLKHVAEIEVDYGVLPPVLCSSQEIQQVALNLLINAADAISELGRIRVSTRREGDWVRFLVSDDGDGIDPDSLDRIFDPFYTTKGVGEGTGLGLSISYEIINRHGGEIVVDSALGKGTTFAVRLPIRGSEASPV
jgi:signal transduction histidine kinase